MNLVFPDFRAFGRENVAGGLELTPVGRSCWELGSFNLRMTGKAQSSGLPASHRTLHPQRHASSSWILFVRHVG